MSKPFLKFEGQILEASPEVISDQEEEFGCFGCVYLDKYEDQRSDVCFLSAYMENKYNMECSELGIIFIPHRFFNSLKKL